MSKEILLIEDDESLNRAVSLKLTKEGYIVYRASTVQEADTLYRLHQVALIICDIELPDGNGVEFCERVREESDVVFLFLTALDTEKDIMRGYQAGADDYITKPFFLTALVSKVNAIMRRHMAAEEPDVLISGSISFSISQNRAKKDGELMKLTAKEQKLLVFFLQNPMRILSKNQILEAIWDVDGSFVDENTLAVNIRRLREKIEADVSNPAYLKNVRGLGYIWEQHVRSAAEESK